VARVGCDEPEPSLPGESGIPSKRELLSEQVARQLRSAILDGALRPGERIGQRRFAQEFGSSPVPVREALRLLQAEGLVVMLPNAGARVARLDLDDLVEIYRIRECLEPLAMEYSVPLLSEHDLRELEAYSVDIEATGSGDDRTAWMELDRQFHMLAMSAAPTRLLRMIEPLWNGSWYYRRLYLNLPEVYEIAQQEHRLLLEAARSRRHNDAALICSMHIRRTRMTLASQQGLFAVLRGSRKKTRPGRRNRDLS